MSTPAQIRERRRARADVSKFAALIADPASGEFDMPARGKLRIVATLGSADGELAATLTGSYRSLSEDEDGNIVKSADPEPREIKTPELEADGYVTLDSIERAVNVQLEEGFEAWVDTGLGVYKKIAESP